MGYSGGNALESIYILDSRRRPQRNIQRREVYREWLAIGVRSESETTLKCSKCDVLEPGIEGIVGAWVW